MFLEMPLLENTQIIFSSMLLEMHLLENKQILFLIC